MSGQASGKPAATGAQAMRDILARLASLEQRTTVRVGTWVLSEDAAGNLIATSPAGVTINVSEPVTQTTVVQTTTDTGSAS